jgi:hypothetical protein
MATSPLLPSAPVNAARDAGDLASYHVTVQKPGWLVIFDAAPDGKLTEVFAGAR